MPRQNAWTAAEVADLRAIAEDTTLTWDEVATALAARVPARAARSAAAVRVAAQRYGLPHRTDDSGRQLRPSTPKRPPSAWSADKAPAPDPVAAGARVAARIPTEGEVTHTLSRWLAHHQARAAGEGWGDGYVEGLVRGRAEVLDALRALLSLYDHKEKTP